MFPLPPRPIEIRCGGDTIGCSPLLLLLDVMSAVLLLSFCYIERASVDKYGSLFPVPPLGA